LAYYWRNWHYLMLGCVLMITPCFLLLIFIPESPRWLFAVNKEEEGKQVMNKFAKINGFKLNDEAWKKATTQESSKSDTTKSYSFKEVLKLPGTRKTLINVMFNWFSMLIVYYGLSLNIGSLAGNIFRNNAISGFLEILSYCSAIICSEKFGRKYTIAGGNAITSISLMISLVLTELGFYDISVVFSFIGKFTNSVSYPTLCNMTAELFPTVIRGRCYALSSVSGRIGSIASSFIISLQLYFRWIPNAVFVSIGLISALSSLLLPKTKGCMIMETVDEAEYFYINKKQISRQKSNGLLKSENLEDPQTIIL